MTGERRLLIVLLLFCFMLLFASPEFSIEQRTHDFGTIYEKDGKIHHKFEFTNSGDEYLEIIDVHAS